MSKDNLIQFNNLSKRLLTSSRFDRSKLKSDGYLVIRNYGVDTLELEAQLSEFSNGKLFFSKRIGGVCHEFTVLPSSVNLSEQMESGGFHTDFFFQQTPPEFVALLCLEPDPKFPLYGINQVVHMSRFLKKIKQVFGISTEDLLSKELLYDLPGYGRYKKQMVTKTKGQLRFNFHEKLLSEEQTWLTPFTPLTIQEVLHCTLIDIAEDICLDKGDLLIVSNYEMLHRRSECSVKFNQASNEWNSRKMATIRFSL